MLPNASKIWVLICLTTIWSDQDVICLKSYERLYGKCQDLHFPHHNLQINWLNHSKTEKQMSTDKNVLIDLPGYLSFRECVFPHPFITFAFITKRSFPASHFFQIVLQFEQNVKTMQARSTRKERKYLHPKPRSPHHSGVGEDLNEHSCHNRCHFFLSKQNTTKYF